MRLKLTLRLKGYNFVHSIAAVLSRCRGTILVSEFTVTFDRADIFSLALLVAVPIGEISSGCRQRQRCKDKRLRKVQLRVKVRRICSHVHYISVCVQPFSTILFGAPFPPFKPPGRRARQPGTISECEIWMLQRATLRTWTPLWKTYSGRNAMDAARP